MPYPKSFFSPHIFNLFESHIQLSNKIESYLRLNQQSRINSNNSFLTDVMDNGSQKLPYLIPGVWLPGDGFGGESTYLPSPSPTGTSKFICGYMQKGK